MKDGLIRRHWDEKEGVWYFSIVDVIAEMTDSTSPASYWKVLKNRLKKSGDQLVTECNQLKMKATDGKSYLTDCAGAQTVVGILELVPKARIHAFQALVGSLTGTQNEEKNPKPRARKLLVDMYEVPGGLIIEALTPGIDPDTLKIVVGRKKILIEGKLKKREKEGEDYFVEEIPNSLFSRTITLPYPVKAASMQKTHDLGHLKIKLEKI